MKRLSQLLITIFFLAIISGGSNVQGAQDVLFQTSLLNALDKGIAEGEMTIKDLKQHGDFGLGTFKYIKTRSIARQNRPYPNLKEMFKTQTLSEFRNVQCIFVGFRCPSYVKISSPGYHFHFITEDKKAGGHVLECHLEKAVVEIDYPIAFSELPSSANRPHKKTPFSHNFNRLNGASFFCLIAATTEPAQCHKDPHSLFSSSGYE